ncbi:MAG TPA: phosphate ABC transporter permease subunit PstC [Longimicrobium sp.]|jgi:phosphate transport system permease protein|uniref:phosphate ABC transporter permease subunit PstC n=1 Tax=Longimicrobium sp. TaxID=2029185 RepID=UPI002ED8F4D8
MQPVPEQAGALAAGAPPPFYARLLPGYAQGNLSDRTYALTIGAFGLAIPVIFALIVIRVGGAAWPAVRAFGAAFVTGTTWDPVAGKFGALPFVFGTVASSLLALLIAVPLSVGLAIFLTELAPRWLAAPIQFGTELLAAIPSVVYGLWAIFVLVPWLRSSIQEPLANSIGRSVGLFAGPAYGSSILAGGVILAIMIVPFVSAVSREVLAAVPVAQREAALALGATRWEMTWQIVVPYAVPGIIGAIILGLGRALGETMAITMVIGNRPEIASSLFAPAATMASVLANEFAEASDDMHLAALMSIGLLLFGITIIVNSVARFLVWRVRLRGGR